MADTHALQDVAVRLRPAQPPNGALPADALVAPDHRARWESDLGKPERVIRAGGKLVPYRPLALPKLYRRFAEVTSAKELRGFIKRYGPLTSAGIDPDVGETVRDMLFRAALMRRMLSAFSDPRQAERARMIPQMPKLADLQATLVLDPKSKKPKIKVSMPSKAGLLSALWLQLAHDQADGVELRSCEKCGKLFEVGVGTGHGWTRSFAARRTRSRSTALIVRGRNRMKGHITRRGKASWRLKFDVPAGDGVRRTCYVTVRGGQKAAQLKLAEILAAVGRGEHVEPRRPPSPTTSVPESMCGIRRAPSGTPRASVTMCC